MHYWPFVGGIRWSLASNVELWYVLLASRSCWLNKQSSWWWLEIPWCSYDVTIMVTKRYDIHYKWSMFKLTKDTAYFTHTGELWGVYCDYFGKFNHVYCLIMGLHCTIITITSCHSLTSTAAIIPAIKSAFWQSIPAPVTHNDIINAQIADIINGLWDHAMNTSDRMLWQEINTHQHHI